VQWAAVNTHLGEITEHPHNPPVVALYRHCHGNMPGDASLPPTILGFPPKSKLSFFELVSFPIRCTSETKAESTVSKTKIKNKHKLQKTDNLIIN